MLPRPFLTFSCSVVGFLLDTHDVDLFFVPGSNGRKKYRKPCIVEISAQSVEPQLASKRLKYKNLDPQGKQIAQLYRDHSGLRPKGLEVSNFSIISRKIPRRALKLGIAYFVSFYQG